MTESPSDRLRRLRLKKFQTAKDAARAYGWNEFTYAAHENGQRGIKLPVARKYAAAFNSTASHILTGDAAEMVRTVNQVTTVPVLARVSAGAFRYDDAFDDEVVVVPAVPRSDIAASVQYSVLIDGPSVNLRIPDGAYAICAPYEFFPGGAQHGQLVHVVRERSGMYEHTIKEFRFSKDGAILAPVSTDPNHQNPITLSTGEDGETVRIQGVVIGAYHPM